MTLDSLVFDILVVSQFLVMVVFVKDEVSVHPCISYFFVMYVVVKWGVFGFIGHICMNNWMVLCELHQYWL